MQAIDQPTHLKISNTSALSPVVVNLQEKVMKEGNKMGQEIR